MSSNLGLHFLLMQDYPNILVITTMLLALLADGKSLIRMLRIFHRKYGPTMNLIICESISKCVLLLKINKKKKVKEKSR